MVDQVLASCRLNVFAGGLEVLVWRGLAVPRPGGLNFLLALLCRGEGPETSRRVLG